MKKISLLAFLFFYGAVATASQATQDILIYLKPKANLSGAPLMADRATRGRFVVQSLQATAEESQKEVIELIQKNGLSYRAFYIENVIRVPQAPAQFVSEVQKMPVVERVAQNTVSRLKTFKIKNPPQDLDSQNQQILGHLKRIQADRVWSELGVKGRGIVIGGQDTGYFWQHNAIRRQYRGFSLLSVNHNYNWHDSFGEFAEPKDDHSHGTHTIGTAVGDDGGTNKIGVAPEAQWIGCRNMKNGVGSVASYMQCFEFFLAPYPVGGDPRKDGRPEMAPHIINNSWSCPEKEGCRGDELLETVRALTAAGIINVVAAGNEGSSCGSLAEPPAHYSGDVIAVAGYNRYQNDALSFSSRGPSKFNGGFLDITAYGDIIRSAMHTGPDRYDDKAGTSMASPQVAGVIALLWSARPELIGQIEQTKEILQKSAQPLTSREACGGVSGSKVPNHTFGYGMLDAYKALTTF